jgi:hypothetical protein
MLVRLAVSSATLALTNLNAAKRWATTIADDLCRGEMPCLFIVKKKVCIKVG